MMYNKLKRFCDRCYKLIDDRSKSGLCKICCKQRQFNGFYKKKHSEENGDYWHCNPTIFKSKDYNRGLKMSAETKWIKDAMRQTILESKGYQYIIF